MNNEVFDNDADLEGVAGGMSCATAIAIAKFYHSVGGVLGALGDDVASGTFYGKSIGVAQGGCG